MRLCCAQAFTPVITMIALFIARLEDPSQRLVTAVLLIALGTAMASYGELNLSWLGLTCSSTSSFTPVRPCCARPTLAVLLAAVCTPLPGIPV